MIVVDSSVWADHLHLNDAHLFDLLNRDKILCHPFVIGELAMGFIKNRNTILSDLHDLPRASVAEHEEVLHLVTSQKLFGLGIGYIDAHLLASTRLTPDTLLWTRDKRLQQAAEMFFLAYLPNPTEDQRRP